jgi:pimeloyl-ACP methyl ester carboxylesterase
MPTAVLDGIETRYEVSGSGPPLLLFSPGGFNATIENWSSFGIYARLDLLARLRTRFTCIAFDKRESGESGGRVERIGWRDYAAQGAALLDDLEIERAHVLGGCIGCSIALAFAVANPERTQSMVLYSPAGGPRYRRTQHARFAEHAAYARADGLHAVAALAASSHDTFAQEPRVGPWVSVLRRDPDFTAAYVAQDVAGYVGIVEEMGRSLFDRDTVPGAAPEPLFELAMPALVVPGHDPTHATSAARYLEECLPCADYWDVAPEAQTAETAPPRILEFLSKQ